MAKVIGVVGAGTMGHGIAWLAALSGMRVMLFDNDRGALTRGLERIEKLAARAAEQGVQEALSAKLRVEPVQDLEAFRDVPFIIEAVWEDMDAKQRLFASLETVCGVGTIFATNTSALSITEIGSVLRHKERFVGMHFFNPPYVMRLVEVVKGWHTSEATVGAAAEMARSLGRVPVIVRKDSPGFIVNRILTAQFVEAIRLVEEGIASPEDIDKAVVYGLNYPMGPFRLQDMIGLDVIGSVIKYFQRELDPCRWRAPQELFRLIRAGRVGKKIGAGWYTYQGE